MAHRLAPEVEAELLDAWYYVFSESGSFEHADRLIDTITQHFILLARYPRMGRTRDHDLRPGLRSFPVSQYVIIYRVDGEDVLILHVIHGRRDIQTLLG